MILLIRTTNQSAKQSRIYYEIINEFGSLISIKNHGQPNQQQQPSNNQPQLDQVQQQQQEVNTINQENQQQNPKNQKQQQNCSQQNNNLIFRIKKSN